jgi:hypothetical protein
MRDYLPAGQGAQIIQESNFQNDFIKRRPGTLNRKGDARSQKLKVVCERCNNGWMSALQNRTEPILSPLLAKQRKVLSPQKQGVLAAWTTMVAMIYDTTVAEYAATTDEQRVAFMEDQKPPQFWAFWCAPFDGVSAPIIQTGFASHGKPILMGDTVTGVLNKASLTLAGAGGFAFAVLEVNSHEAFQAFTQFISTIVVRAGYVKLWPTAGAPLRITDGRTAPLSYHDLCTIRDVIHSAVKLAAATLK